MLESWNSNFLYTDRLKILFRHFRKSSERCTNQYKSNKKIIQKMRRIWRNLLFYQNGNIFIYCNTAPININKHECKDIVYKRANVKMLFNTDKNSVLNKIDWLFSPMPTYYWKLKLQCWLFSRFFTERNVYLYLFIISRWNQQCVTVTILVLRMFIYTYDFNFS